MAQSTFRPGQNVAPHTHVDATEIVFVLKGTASIVVNGQMVTVGAGSVVVISPGETHAFGNTSPTEEMQMLYFTIS